MTIQQMDPIKRDALFDRLTLHAQRIKDDGIPLGVYRTIDEAFKRERTELPFLWRLQLNNDVAFVAGLGSALGRLRDALSEPLLEMRAVSE